MTERRQTSRADRLLKQHARQQSQDEDTLDEALRLVLASQRGLEEAARDARDDAEAARCRAAAAERREIAAELHAWLLEQDFQTPEEAAPLASGAERMLIDLGAELNNTGTVQQTTLQTFERGVLGRMKQLLRDADLTPDARRVLASAVARLKAAPIEKGGGADQ